MLDIIITHYREPWEVCRKQFLMLDLQRRVYWSQIRVTVVNDGGYQLPDTELEKLHYPVRQVNIPHGGISAARNAGIDHATGEWIMFCDCDDCFANIYGLEDIQNVLPQATEKYDIMWTKCYEEDSVNNRILLIPMHKTFVFCHGKIYRREFLLKEGIHVDWSNAERIKKLVKFPTARSDAGKSVFLEDYVKDMAISYLIDGLPWWLRP